MKGFSQDSFRRSGERKARKEIKEKILDYKAQNGIKIQNRLGHEINLDEFITQIIGDTEAEKKKTRRNVIVASLVLALGVVALLLIFFLVR